MKDDEKFLSVWEERITVYKPAEILNLLCKNFPVKFNMPEKIRIEIYNSFAGKIPIIIFEDDSDFENFIISLIYKGKRPENISQMGASFIYGKTQRFIALSKKFYSGVSAEYVGLSTEEWREKSMIIRREHEITHYYTKKFFGKAENNIKDELIADFIGIYKAFGFYEAKLFNHFMGIDGTREGRLSLYIEGISEDAEKMIIKDARRCSNFLEAWSKSDEFQRMDTPSRINFLYENDIKSMAGEES